MTQRLSLPLRWSWLLASLAACGAAAQVTPAEPFGGRPFGSAPAPAQAPQPAAPPAVVVQPGAAPVVVQPPAAAPVVVPPPPPAPQQAAGGTVGAMTRPSSVSPPAAQAAPAMQSPAMQAPAPAPHAAPAPAPVTPPFAANRNAPGAAAAPAPQQQPVKGLPADAPRLVISGSVYSHNPAQRLLIVNGQPVREGADVGPGVVVEQVQRDGAVLAFRGSRYTVVF